MWRTIWRRLGCAVTLLSRIGDDDSGRLVASHAAAAGIDISLFTISAAHAHGIVHRDPRAERRAGDRTRRYGYLRRGDARAARARAASPSRARFLVRGEQRPGRRPSTGCCNRPATYRSRWTPSPSRRAGGCSRCCRGSRCCSAIWRRRSSWRDSTIRVQGCRMPRGRCGRRAPGRAWSRRVPAGSRCGMATTCRRCRLSPRPRAM